MQNMFLKAHHLTYMYITKQLLWLLSCCGLLSLVPPRTALPLERVRVRVLLLVAKAYSTIRLSELCSLLGQSEAAVRQGERAVLRWLLDFSGVLEAKSI